MRNGQASYAGEYDSIDDEAADYCYARTLDDLHEIAGEKDDFSSRMTGDHIKLTRSAMDENSFFDPPWHNTTSFRVHASAHNEQRWPYYAPIETLVKASIFC